LLLIGRAEAGELTITDGATTFKIMTLTLMTLEEITISDYHEMELNLKTIVIMKQLHLALQLLT
jgi:hypothetical protein